MENRYKELEHVAKRYYRDSGYCSVIALAVCCDLKFGKARKAMERGGRSNGRGVNMTMIRNGLAEFGFEGKLVYDVKPCTMTTVARQLDSSKTYMVFVNGHVAAVKGGMVQDWTEGRRHKVQCIWEIVKAA